jgi:predicted transcriptional regulator
MNLGLLSLTYTDVKQHQVLNEFYSMYVGVDSFLWRCDVGNKFINLHKRMLKIRERKLEAQKLRRRKKIDEVLANSDALRDFYLGLECLDSSSDEALKQAMLGVIRSVCTPREAFAIEEYIWGAEATYKSVGELMGITRERVRQIIMKGERRLRVPPNARVLLESASSVISLPSELYDGGLTEYDEFPYFKKGGEEDGS